MSTQTIPITVTNWFEVYSANTEASKSFYSQVFGWTYSSMPMGPERTYWMIQKGEEAFAGIMDLSDPQMEGVPPHWGIYLDTQDCAATLAKVTELGGTVVYGPMSIPDIGVVGGFTDCCGAHVNVHEPAGERKELIPGAVNWVEQMGPSRESAVKFYTTLFGWGTIDHEMGDGVGTYTLFTIGEGESTHSVAGCMTVPDPSMPPCWLVYLHSDNLESTCAAVTEAGGTVLNPPMDIGQFGRVAVCADCCGAVFGLHQPPC